MSEKILCPFCKKPIYAVSCGIEDEAWVVLHDGDNCPFEMDGKNGYIWSSKEELVKALNTRPIEDTLREENKKLKDALMFYAADGNWNTGIDHTDMSMIESDKGDIAREALK